MAVGAVEGRWLWSRKRRLIARSDMGCGARSCSNEYAGCTGALGAESRREKSRGKKSPESGMGGKRKREREN